MNRILTTLFLIIVLTTCTTKTNQQEASLDWLVGTWTIDEPDGIQTIEVWDKAGDGSYYGFNVSLDENRDTIFSENIEIKDIDKQMFYIVTVPDQNNGLEIRFKLVSNDSGKYIFENAEHDFPQRIVYKLEGSDSLHAYIEGMTSEDDSRMDFYFIKQ